jgi:antitoxin HicB
MTMRFVVVLEPDEQAGGYNVTVPALPGCFTQGDTVDQSLERAKDAIATYLDDELPESLRAAGVDPTVLIEVVEVATPLSA